LPQRHRLAAPIETIYDIALETQVSRLLPSGLAQEHASEHEREDHGCEQNPPPSTRGENLPGEGTPFHRLRTIGAARCGGK
jgi:hypothetical protein